jgi:hypothetical protein
LTLGAQAERPMPGTVNTATIRLYGRGQRERDAALELCCAAGGFSASERDGR